jgi:hypothetical protein
MFIISCKQDKPADAEIEEVAQTAQELSQTFAERIPKISDDFKNTIFDLQEQIKIDPENVELRKQFCDAAYSQDKMVMITMGIAKLTNPETGEQFNRGMVERTAKIDASRWALYGTNWLIYDYEPAFTEIKGNFSRNTQVVDKVVVGDSLFLYLASDLSN